MEYDKESLEQIRPLKEGSTYKTSSPTEGDRRAIKALKQWRERPSSFRATVLLHLCPVSSRHHSS